MQNVAEKYIGATNTANCGLGMQVIAYRDRDHVDIRFADGAVVLDRSIKSFLSGAVRHPTITTTLEKREAMRRKYIGKRYSTRSGHEVEIIEYRGAFDVDVRFEDGAVSKHHRVGNVVRGQVRHPDYHKNLLQQHRDSHVGEKVQAKCGMMMELIAYRSCNDVDVRFEDGTIVPHRVYSEFWRREIGHPQAKERTANQFLGMKNTASNGIEMEIIRYNGKNDIDVRFEDGTIVKKRALCSFRSGCIAHPNFEISRGTVTGDRDYCGFDLREVAFRDARSIYYICRCKTCGYSNILTPQEMMEHQKICPEAYTKKVG